MFIIFGVQRKVTRLATVLALCAFCHTPAAQVVIKVRTFFSLFFIPIIPMGTKYRATCTLCGQTSEITAEEAEQAQHAQAMHQGAQQVPQAPPVVAGGSGPGWAAPPAAPQVQQPPASLPPFNPYPSQGAPPTGPAAN